MIFKYNKNFFKFLNKFISSSSNDNSIITTLPFIKHAKQIYLNPILQRKEINENLKNKSGIYCWINKINGKSYIGSAINLNNRINDYYQNSYYRDKKNMLIVRAILKYGLDNFALIILDIVKKNEVLIQEQYWLDDIKPDYNILELATNSKGYKHKLESIEIMKKKALRRKHSEEVRNTMSENRKGEKNAFFGKTHSEETIKKFKAIAKNRIEFPKKGIEVEIIDLENNKIELFKSIRAAARFLNTNIYTLISREKRNTKRPYKGKYKILIKRL